MATENKKAPWDINRFVKTLNYFGVIPFLGSCRWLQKLFGGEAKPPSPPSEVVLVVGATGGVGKRVVKRLQQQGIKVRALVRDRKRGLEMLGNKVDIMEADLTIPETLTPQVMQDVTAIICCSGTRVQPVEGDTPTREKYYQGVKFYMPEVVDIPELVEYKGIQNLINATPNTLRNSGQKILFDFTKPDAELKATWGALDDVVMGGVSESSLRLIGDAALFTGNVSTANSGGFVSVRTRNFEPPLDLSEFAGIELRVKGDGKRYKFIARSDEKWDSIGYCYSFDTVYNIPMTIRIPFEQLIPVFRAKTLKDNPGFNSKSVYAFQLMLSKFEYDGELNPKFEAGMFQLQIESIKAYGNAAKPRLVMVSSAGVTRPGKPGLNLDEEPPAVRMNDQLGGILTWKLRGENVVRSSNIPYTIIRPCAMTEEPGGEALMFDQGDTIKGKVSREDIAELCIKALNQPSATNVTVEVKALANGDRSPHSAPESGLFATLQPD
ncbi:MAG: CIA30 family protein [Limnospira sp. PMC 1291.21]|uniref:CIA30 family protein n=1 Tax=unclassified Limnospira TaxID=2642885 RepID=UPI0028E17353|nr:MULTISPECIES: CIA30 family protein [unclassified Limnospira]MDT9179602.1 CIA30 family protein [Limnospira sp. PMC 1238.20]MDT9194863.1 CIA30 family protein [Limnospira sp. PMC 1245.20]MDT9202019.1 CIA30 family protein [Limnospira sp. PMC 1243.20]MDT9210310.1 CIA30 family protein [Limnospira sp. PMC 1252.20]MDT9212436.1 CIA30 family protein [Limnospira sp. PMC 1256.20]